MDFKTWNLIHQLGTTTLDNFLIDNYAKVKISDIEFLVILQIIRGQKNANSFVSQSSIADNMNLSVQEVGQVIQNLIDKELMTIEQIPNSENKITDYYNLDEIYHKILQYLIENELVVTDDKQHLVKNATIDPIQDLVRKFEIEFGRLLSPIERQTVLSWVNQDKYQPAVIQLALQEAVLSQVYNFKYVDRILLNWQRSNLNTADQVKRYLQNK